MWWTKQDTELARTLGKLHQRVEELEEQVHKPELEALLSEYHTFVTAPQIYPFYRTGKYLTRYDGHEYTNYTADRFRSEILAPLKAAAYDSHVCPSPNTNPTAGLLTGLPSSYTYTYTTSVPASGKSRKRKRRK